jgi:phage terminase large subunit
MMIEGGRAGGKSHFIGTLLPIRAAQKKTRILCAREIQRSIKDSVHHLISQKIADLGLGGFTITDKSIKHSNGSEFIFMGIKGGSKQEEITRMKSLEDINICWLEEAQGLRQESIDLIDPTIRGEGAQIIATFNRYHESDPIYKTYCTKPSDNTLHLKVNYYDNPLCPAAIIEQAEKMKSEDYDSYLHIFEGEPINQSDQAILSRREVIEATKRKASQEGSVEVGADIARYGSDKTVFFKKIGFQVVEVREYKKKSVTEVVRLLADFAGDALIKVDDTGVGGGVTDGLRDLGKNVQAVNFGSSPKDKNKYTNKISELWFFLKEHINEIGLPDDTELVEELTGRQWVLDPKGRRAVEKKDDFKKRVGRSPDKADALLLAFGRGVDSKLQKFTIKGF